MQRMAVQMMRLPVAFLALAVQGVIQGLLQASLFNDVVKKEFSWRDRDLNMKVTMNMLGLAFQAASDQFIMMSMAQILTIPVARPIFEREVANRVYSSTAYYIANVAAGFFFFFLYPCFTALISYWFFGFENPDWRGLIDWMCCLTLPAVAGALWGMTLGTFFVSE